MPINDAYEVSASNQTGRLKGIEIHKQQSQVNVIPTSIVSSSRVDTALQAIEEDGEGKRVQCFKDVSPH